MVLGGPSSGFTVGRPMHQLVELLWAHPPNDLLDLAFQPFARLLALTGS